MKKAKKQSEKTSNIVALELRRLGVIIEHVDGTVSLVVEQYGDTKKTLDNHSKILDSHTEMIGSIKMDIEVIKADITFIKGGLKRKVDTEEFSILERRVALLEKHR
ncbi:MAG: hypothetical protein G01um101429_777 [Parcubacteria group bacterium Gr01-1014_29]|nr:MAG: hypothetical protein G01um101429_777 [Parcubacteria group bacterium Gr01-1014_29]